jgi:acyl transferase domain-containing protein
MMQSLPGGAMLAVGMHEADLQPWLGPDASIGVINGPEMCVVSGTYEAVDRLEKAFGEKGILARKLMTSHAFHSVMMEPVVREFVEEVKKVPLQAPSIPYVSNVSGTWITEKEATDPAYWGRHLRQTVRFGDALGLLLQAGDTELVEVGPGKVLVTLAARFPGQTQRVLNTLPHPQEQAGDLRTLLGALGRLWANGARVDWNGFYAGQQRNRLDLPTYPFERQRYWIEPDEQTGRGEAGDGLVKDIWDWFYIPVWRAEPVKGSEDFEPGGYLVFDDETGLGEMLTDRLQKQGCTVAVVRIGSRFEELRDNAYTISLSDPASYEKLIRRVIERHGMPKRIIHLWNIFEPDNPGMADETFTRSQARGFFSLLYLAQAIDAVGISDRVQLLVVSGDMQDLPGSEKTCPEKSTLMGPVRVLPLEYANIPCRSVDLASYIPSEKLHRTAVDQIVSELGVQEPAVVAYRRGERYVESYEPVRLAKDGSGVSG